MILWTVNEKNGIRYYIIISHLMLKQNKEIKGVKIGYVKRILSQFVDDMTIILDGFEQSLATAIKTLDSFAKLSNLKANSSKTRAKWIGCKNFVGKLLIIDLD